MIPKRHDPGTRFLQFGNISVVQTKTLSKMNVVFFFCFEKLVVVFTELLYTTSKTSHTVGTLAYSSVLLGGTGSCPTLDWTVWRLFSHTFGGVLAFHHTCFEAPKKSANNLTTLQKRFSLTRVTVLCCLNALANDERTNPVATSSK